MRTYADRHAQTQTDKQTHRSKQFLNLVSKYLCDRIQRTKIGEKYSTWHNVIYGVPQGSNL